MCRTSTHSIRQRVLIRVLWRCALLYLFQQQGVFDQTASREIQEVPEVQFPAEWRLLTQAQEVLHSLLVLLQVQQGFCSYLVTAVCNIGLQARELHRKGGEFDWDWIQWLWFREEHNRVDIGNWREWRWVVPFSLLLSQSLVSMEILTQFIRVGPTSPTVFSDPLSRSRRLRRSGMK